MTLQSGDATLGRLDLPAKTKPGWHTSGELAVDGADLNALTLTFVTTRQSGPGPTRVSAAYLEVTGAADGTAPAGAPLGPEALGPAGPAGPPAPPAVEVVTPTALGLPARATAVPLALGCPAEATTSCHGTVELQVAGAAPAPSHHRARAARCARGCRVIGKGAFDIAPGSRKQVPVKLTRASRKVLRRGRTVKATLVVTTRNRSGHATVVRRPIRIRRSG